MKSLIIPITFFIALIVLFVIIFDQKEFLHNHDNQTIQIEKTTAYNSTASVSSEAEMKFVSMANRRHENETKTDAEEKIATKSTPTEDKPVSEAKSNEIKSIGNKTVAETNPVETKQITEEMQSENVIKQNETETITKPQSHKPVPAAVPILTPEEADILVKRMLNEREEAKKYGLVFYEEGFISSGEKNDSQNDYPYKDVQQTHNWKIVQIDQKTDKTPAAIIHNGIFTINSDIPLEYTFNHPVFEHTMYCYTLGCTANGKGNITISSKGTNRKKKFIIDSRIPVSFAFLLGEGNTFDKDIEPTISFQGDLQIESITLYQRKIRNERTICLGEIEEISTVPDIKKSNYPDCYYTAKLVVKQILDGESVPEDIQLLIPAFLNNKIDPLSERMKVGEFKLSIRPFSSATKEEQEIEQVDEIDSFSFSPYILVNAYSYLIPDLHESAIPILEERNYAFPYKNPINPSLNEKYANDSIEVIRTELLKINNILSSLDNDVNQINSEFQTTWNERSHQYNELNKTTIWAKEQNSYFALPKIWKLIHPKAINDDNLQALKELNLFFKSQGIQFILQIVPDYRDIAALVLNPEFQKYGDQQSALVAKQLLEAGIETQYISDDLVKNAFNYERMFYYPNDFHPDQGATDIMTDRIAHRLKLLGDIFPIQYKKEHFSTEYHDTTYKDNLKWPSNCNIGTHEANTNVQTPHIYYEEKPISRNPQSKILLFGNSFLTNPYSDAYNSYLTSKILYSSQSIPMGGLSPLTALPQLFLTETEKYLKDRIVAILPISISYLVSDASFLNVKQLNNTLEHKAKETMLFSLSPERDGSIIFPYSFSFSQDYPYFEKCISNHTSLAVLSSDKPEISIHLPSSDINSITVNFLPLHKVDATIQLNEKAYKLNQLQFVPNWQTIRYDTNDKLNSLSIKLSLDKSSKNAFVLVGNISGYK